ncbi:MAG TPA: GNAT family N-acetyltransferase [Anaerohalosphaeraceae bacterium]|jgi:acyl-CoA hydrolase/GNAT superfamily N-acetyltransferase|nr:GNAT family N-acetyltransferase [Anaerohalosphaeraceae bacterium]HRT50778.1 GNAT family N-acetyltransferase [Anaerohalosphaeraceae bacterium]HRT86814.1 GNAT family N-acetyltransferase [Anaerohalosphaeraceae bacterium]
MSSKQVDWREKYAGLIGTAADAMQLVKPGDSIFIGTGCGQPQYLVRELMAHSAHIFDSNIIHFLTMGPAPYMSEKFRDKFKVNSFFITDSVRESIQEGLADYSPIFLSEIPQEFETGRIPLDIAFISVTPPDANGLCSLGISVDIVKSAAANAKYVVAQVNANMPRTLGDCFLHVNSIDMLVPFDEPVVTAETEPSDDVLRRIGQNVARLVEDGSTIECSIGRIAQAMAEFLKDKKELGIHTEMFGDWIIDLVECGAVTCSKKTINRGKIVASFAMGSKRLYDYIDNNPFFEFHPTEYVNDPFVISQHDKMVGINEGLEIDLTGQVCADSSGYRFCSGIGGQVDFIRGCARSRGGKGIIVMPSTNKDETVSRIVPKLSEGAGVVTTRGDVHYVVTEYGIAYLHGKTIRERVLALVNIAHPKFRKELMQAAKAQKYLHADQIELPWENVRYPEELERYDTLRDGTQIFLRPVKPTDETALSEMLYSLSEATVKKRYFTHTKTFPHRDVQKLTNIDYQNELAVVGVVPGPAEEEIVAIAQYFLEPRTRAAEVAFIVHDEWQAKGMGTLLLDYIVRIAAQRGVKSFYATVMPDNKAMLNIFYNSGHNINTKFNGQAYEISLNLAE